METKNDLIEFNPFGDLLWATYQTKAGKKFIDLFIKEIESAKLWSPDTHQNEHAIYYGEGRRSVARMMKEHIEERQKPVEEVELKND